MEEIILLSGGLDSFTSWAILNHERKSGLPAIHVSLGQRYEAKEKRVVRALAENNGIDVIFDDRLRLSDLEGSIETGAIIPLRNMFLIAIASLYADKVYIVFERGATTYLDRRPEFLQKASELLGSISEHPVQIVNPFPDLTKSQLVAQYAALGLNPEQLKQTVSCYDPADLHCGACGSCFRKWVAFEYNCISTSGMFVKSVTEWRGLQDYIEQIRTGKMEPERARETTEVLGRHGITITGAP